MQSTFDSANMLKNTITKNLKCHFVVNWKKLNNMILCEVFQNGEI